MEGYCYDPALVLEINRRRPVMTPFEIHEINNLVMRYMAASGYYEEIITPKPALANQLAFTLQRWLFSGRLAPELMLPLHIAA